MCVTARLQQTRFYSPTCCRMDIVVDEWDVRGAVENTRHCVSRIQTHNFYIVSAQGRGNRLDRYVLLGVVENMGPFVEKGQ